MPKNRMRQRENKKRGMREEMLDTYNSYGAEDLTAYQAVKKIKGIE